METPCYRKRQVPHDFIDRDIEQASPFSQQWVRITKEEHIALTHRANYWQGQYAQLKQKFDRSEAESQRKDAKIKDLQNRLFGKKSEKQGSAKSEKGEKTTSNRKRGQQPGRGGHGLSVANSNFSHQNSCLDRLAARYNVPYPRASKFTKLP